MDAIALTKNPSDYSINLMIKRLASKYNRTTFIDIERVMFVHEEEYGKVQKSYTLSIVPPIDNSEHATRFVLSSYKELKEKYFELMNGNSNEKK